MCFEAPDREEDEALSEKKKKITLQKQEVLFEKFFKLVSLKVIV